MEKDGYFSWQFDSHSTAAAAAEMNTKNNHNHNHNHSNNNCIDESQSAGSSSMIMGTSCFPNLNWDQSSTDQTCNFESALSSLVSSPTSSNPNPNPNLPSSCAADSIVIRELIGRLGSICSNNSSSSCMGMGMGMGNGGEEMSNPNSNNNNNSQSYHSTNTSSCYSTPLNSPTKLNLAMIQDDHHPQFQFPHPIPFAADPGFAERAARFSCFGTATSSNNNAQFTQSLKAMTSTGAAAGMRIGGQLDMMMMMMIKSSAGEFAQPESSQGALADRIHVNVKKRKAATASSNSSNKGNIDNNIGVGGEGKEAAPANHPKVAEEEDNLTSKRCKSVAEAIANSGADHKDTAAKTPKVEQGNTNSASGQGQKQQDKDNNNANPPPEPPKQDFIHVRARRGQATDSHSLAERVRREKISERMKFLQDLVPSCNKVTGKAVMLDEIINYVQSLQRQVEFLSMKLATVNPRLELNVDTLLSKDSSYPLEASCTSTGFSYENQLPQGHGHSPPPLQGLVGGNGLDNNPLAATSLRRSLSMHLPPLDGFTDTAASSQSQLAAFWEDDLESVVQMGLIGQNPKAIFSSHSFQQTT